MSEEEFQHERPLEYQRMIEQGKLSKLETTPPTQTSLVWARIIGVFAYGVGLIMILLIIYSALKELH